MNAPTQAGPAAGSRRRGKRGKTIRERVKIEPRLLDAAAVDQESAVRAAGKGWRMRVAWPKCNDTITPHCMVEDAKSGRRLADWWPASGLATFPDGYRDHAATWTELLDSIEHFAKRGGPA